MDRFSLPAYSLISNHIESVHGDVDVLVQHTFNCGYGVLNGLGDQEFFVFAEPAQHMGNGIFAIGWLSYSDTQTRELF